MTPARIGSVATTLVAAHMAAAAAAYAQEDTTALTIAPEEPSISERALTYINEQTDPYFPWPWLIGGAALALGAGGLAARRGVKGYGFYSGAVLLTTGALINPISPNGVYETLPDIVVVAVDETGSNQVAGRTNLTETILGTTLDQLAAFENTEPLIVRFDGAQGPGRLSAPPLLRALRQSDVDPDQLSGVIVISDGNLEVPDALPSGWDAPLHGFLSGAEGETDRVMTLISAPRYTILGAEPQPLQIHFQVDDVGVPAAQMQPISVNVRHEGELIQTLDALPKQETVIEIDVDSPGENIFTIEPQALAGEVTDANNILYVNIGGIEDSVNVLALSGIINEGLPWYRQVIKEDPQVNFIHHTVLVTAPNKMFLFAGLEDRDEELSLVRFPEEDVVGAAENYDAIILNNFENHYELRPSTLRAVTEYVENGGLLFVTAGPEFAGRLGPHSTNLRDVLPVRPTREIYEPDVSVPLEELQGQLDTEFLPLLTELGARHPITRDLPGANLPFAGALWNPWIRVIGAEVVSDTAQVLMETPNGNPLLVVDRIGDGKVVVLLSDSAPLMWDDVRQGPARELILNSMLWGVDRYGMEDERLSADISGENELLIRRRTLSADTPAAVTIQDPTGALETYEDWQELGPGNWEIPLQTTQNGIYTITQNGDTPLQTFVTIGEAASDELAQVIATDTHLIALADRYNGTLSYALTEAGDLAVPTLSRAAVDVTTADLAEDAQPAVLTRGVEELRSYEETPKIPLIAWAFGAAACLLGTLRSNQNLSRRRNAVAAKSNPQETGPTLG